RSVEELDLTPAGPVTPSPESWEDHRFYFAFVDRFNDGDPDNNRAGWSDYDPTDPWKAHGGDIRGLIDKLDYIQGLGVNALWINPVAQNLGPYHGYATVHGLAVDPSRGSPDELRELVDRAHARGMRVILDVVPNHTAPVRDYPDHHTGFSSERVLGTQFASDRPRPFPRELRRTEAFHDRGSIQDWNDPDQALNADFLGGLSDLNTEDPKTVEALSRTLKWWIARFDIDGFRVDAVKHAPNSFWDQVLGDVLDYAESIGKDNFLLMPEILDGDPAKQVLEIPRKDGTRQSLSPLNHPLFFRLKEVFAEGAPSKSLADVLRSMEANFDNPNLAGNFVDSHDFPRFLHSVGSHDAYRAALATMFAAPGLPIIYYGSEQGFSGGEDPYNREDLFANEDYAYSSVPNPGGDNFDTGHSLYRSMAELNAVREHYPELRHGETQIRWERSDRASLLAFARRYEGSEVLFAVNPTASQERAPHIALDPKVFRPGDVVVDELNPPRQFIVGGSDDAPTVDLTLEPYQAALLTKGALRLANDERAERPTEQPRMVLYQLLPRTFGNVKNVNEIGGDVATNGVGKFADINTAALDDIREQGHTHVYLTGVIRQATSTAHPEVGFAADDPDILKGRAGSPFAIKDYFDVSPDYATDPKARMEEFEALVDRVHDAGLEVLIDLVPNHVARSYESTVRPDLNFGRTDDPTKRFDPQNNFFYLTDEPGRPLTLPKRTDAVEGADGRFAPEDGGPGRTPRRSGN
ncbi:MAG: alpha-amylase family glycosyl hydrolase, partial [Myxococcota bacterium]